MHQLSLDKGREGRITEKAEHGASAVTQGPPSPDGTKHQHLSLQEKLD